MDKDRIKGTVTEIKGSVKEAAGKVLNKPALVEKGQEQKLEGRIQQTVGAIKDSLKGK